MSKKSKSVKFLDQKKSNPTTNPEPEAVEPEAVEPEAEFPKFQSPEMQALGDLIANLSPELKAKAQRQLGKLVEESQRNKDSQLWEGFNTELQEALIGKKDNGKIIEDGVILKIAKKHQVAEKLENRRIVVTFSAGTIAYTHTIVGKKTSSNGGGSRTGVGTNKTTYNKVELDGKEYASLNALAFQMGWKYNGRANGLVACTDPRGKDNEKLGISLTATDKDGNPVAHGDTVNGNIILTKVD